MRLLRPRILISLVLGLLLLVAQSSAHAEDPIDWTQWRGPNRTSIVAGVSWPEELNDKSLEQLWRKELGPSYSGPIVVGSQVFTTETKDRKFEVVRAFDRTTGKPLWETQWEGAMSVPFFAKANGDWIRSTPAYDDGRLYVAGMRDVLVCLNAETGEVIWKVDFVKDLKTPLPAFGFVCSPLVDGGHVYVQAGGSLVKLNKLTGEIVWQSLKDGGGMYGSAFSSPVLGKVAGERQLIVQTRTELAGVAPDSGDKLWSEKIPAFRGMNILTPTIHEDGVFTSSYGGRTLFFNIKDEDGKPALNELWDNKAQAYMSSPVVVDGFAYLHLRNQRFTCINLETGESPWTTKPYGKYWSMVASGDKILALDERGELLLIKSNPKEFTLLGTCDVGENAWAHLAVCGDEVFIRQLKSLTAYRWK